MPPDAARVAETREWLAKAALDLRAAEFEVTAQPPLTADIVFHCQQLAEKSLKGFLVWHDVPFRKTHNLVEIGQQCTAVDPTLESLLRRAAGLTEYAWRFRYPGQLAEPPVAEAQGALAREVYEAILSRLPEETCRDRQG
ncbi:MAG: HEPN domain-containing protein [Chloroflexi bacterium]|nr:HEPN domain-containing protein [Chloroflexota bacterium]MCL5108072.1 HEPN domain-containing protein [Chloroflexota bacterium]MDA8219885.1 HEPN domain-containing protein [Dehalococcoidales bacterium]